MKIRLLKLNKNLFSLIPHFAYLEHIHSIYKIVLIEWIGYRLNIQIEKKKNEY